MYLPPPTKAQGKRVLLSRPPTITEWLSADDIQFDSPPPIYVQLAFADMVLSQPPPILDQKVPPTILEPSKGFIAQLLPVS